LQCTCTGGPAPVRQYLPKLIDLIWNRTINQGKVADLELPLEDAAEGNQAMRERFSVPGRSSRVRDGHLP
jgi:threonine dehydrogenase-like Zn-dependent dehydrogenase